MYNPKYTITPKLLANIKKIGIIVAALNNRRFSKVILYNLEKTAREISAYSSTSIEGNPLPLTEVKKILKNKPEYLRDSEREVINYNKALEFLNKGIKNDTLKFNIDLILKIHSLVVDGLIDSFNIENFRRQPVFVNDPRTGKPVYLPPDHQDVITLMKDLVKFIVNNIDCLDPLIIAGIFHKRFVIIHPFLDGNGRTARLTSKVLLAHMGLNTFNLFSFENYYNKNITKYFKSVGAFGNYYDLKDQFDYTGWLEYFTDGIIDELLRVSKILEQKSLTPAASLKIHHQKILDYIAEKGFITNQDYSTLTNRAKPTRNKDFNKLIDLGLIKRFGKGKGTYYKLNS